MLSRFSRRIGVDNVRLTDTPLLTSGFTVMSLPVTLSLLPSHARDLGTLWGELPPFEVLFNTLFFRIYGYPCEGTGAQFEVHARTN